MKINLPLIYKRKFMFYAEKVVFSKEIFPYIVIPLMTDPSAISNLVKGGYSIIRRQFGSESKVN